ncbi:DinB family protein [Adhaeribacter sp. BT258]|uniref:DinB family protein n=1 Tax=Adhaeribacter terrigena TaxID=2793070 RepID=A0ABS1C3A2_9BACT|nr:DinB family protein [Adhaeribacter terrigena]MBK0403844.1 DinB family protein [Adhaeribacter terrigena]
MNPKIQLWEKELNEITAQFKSHFGHLTPEELNRKPDAKTWSIAENMAHLIKINESYYPVVKAAREGHLKLPFIARFSFFTNRLGKFILKSVEPERKKKVKTFPIWEPNASQLSGNILQQFEKHQREFISFMKGTEGLLSKQTIISSPANNMIVYKLETAYDIIVSHEKRHLNQALEVLQQQQ